ncbi:ABC transporter ATP-binding protein [Lachnospira pectinoschiza]|uniref:ATP-binding cassette, subfamily B n=1 Tax=Lachnospira pectinoschiza TaxID=28052 RepID=A0A1G9WNZ0_9FIRM|nr:ABC transporter ATP-binding protein [Lachnospira pectinoschiza]SDM86107.1 ATP-binding cassette, subfamily B [Lachnospira pectinoschiza]
MNKNVEKDNTFGRLIGYIFKHYAPQLIVTIICIIIAALASVIATIFLQRIIDEVITPAMGIGMDSVWSKFIGIIITMGAIYILGVIASFTYTRLMANVTQGTLMHLRNDMFERMQTLPIKYFDTNAHGDIMSTYTNDTDAIRQLIGQSLPQLFQSGLTIAGIIIMMCFYSIWLTVVVGVFIFLMTRVVKNFGGNSAKYMMAQQRTLAKEEGFVEEMMEGSKVIKVFNHEEESKEAFKKINEELFEASDKANKYGNMLMPTLGNIGNIMYVVLAVVGGLLVYYSVYNLSLQNIFTGAHGAVSLGIIISFLSMSRQLSQTVGQVSMQVSMIAMGLAGARRVFELMDQEPEFDEGYVTLVRAKYTKEGELVEADEDTSLWAWKHPHKADGTVTYTPLKGDIVLEDVDFGYVKNKLVLHDVSLYAKPGQKIAFVGATGAGKTTITNLINRFYDIEDGKIRYDGININKIRKTDLRRSLGIVLQDVNLFTGTVLDNIRYGKLNATDEECIAAAKLANAHHFIERLPDGYNTMLTANGANLSQGQRQLLSIARAAVANPPVMILDEATSSIDTRTEAIVQAGMDNLMFGRTVFVIAHRLSTVRNSKAIMVLDHGRIIERGDHDALIDQKGTYYQLYTGAFELE